MCAAVHWQGQGPLSRSPPTPHTSLHTSLHTSAHTPQGVYQALTTIIKECGGKDDEEAEVYLKQLESKGCYMQDIF